MYRADRESNDVEIIAQFLSLEIARGVAETFNKEDKRNHYNIKTVSLGTLAQLNNHCEFPNLTNAKEIIEFNKTTRKGFKK